MAGLVPHQEDDRLRIAWSKPEELQYRAGDWVLDEKGYRVTISVIALVFQVIFVPRGGKLTRDAPFAREVWTRIQPISKGDWPPKRWLSPEAMERFASGSFTFVRRPV